MDNYHTVLLFFCMCILCYILGITTVIDFCKCEQQVNQVAGEGTVTHFEAQEE